MAWFKSKRETYLEELAAAYKAEIQTLKEENKAVDFGRFISIPKPSESDMPEYYRQLSALVDNEFLLFYLTQLRRSVVDEFEVAGKDSAEFYRGQLAAVGKVFSDASKAKRVLQGALV